jgi:hypothetical protein
MVVAVLGNLPCFRVEVSTLLEGMYGSICFVLFVHGNLAATLLFVILETLSS